MTDNHTRLSGTVKRIKSMQSPAGIPHWIVTLEHQSQRYEAELLRSVYLRIQVIMSGVRFAPTAEKLKAGMKISVEGFIAMQTSRGGQNRMVLHAEQVDLKI